MGDFCAHVGLAVGKGSLHLNACPIYQNDCACDHSKTLTRWALFAWPPGCCQPLHAIQKSRRCKVLGLASRVGWNALKRMGGIGTIHCSSEHPAGIQPGSPATADLPCRYPFSRSASAIWDGIEATTLEIGRFIFQRGRSDRRQAASNAAGGTIGSWPGPCRTSRSRCRCFASSTCCRCSTSSDAVTPPPARILSRRARAICRRPCAWAWPWPRRDSLAGRALAIAARRNAHGTPGGSSPAATRPKCWPRPCASGS